MFNLVPITILLITDANFMYFSVGHKLKNYDWWKGVNFINPTTLLLLWWEAYNPIKIIPFQGNIYWSLWWTQTALYTSWFMGKGGELLWQVPEVLHSHADKWGRLSLPKIFPFTQHQSIGQGNYEYILPERITWTISRRTNSYGREKADSLRAVSDSEIYNYPIIY